MASPTARRFAEGDAQNNICLQASSFYKSTDGLLTLITQSARRLLQTVWNGE